MSVSSADKSHQIVLLRDPLSQRLAASIDPDGKPVHRLSNHQLVPKRALELLREIRSVLCRRLGIDPTRLTCQVQTSAAEGLLAGRMHSGVVLLLADSPDLGGNTVQDARACAAEFIAMLSGHKLADKIPFTWLGVQDLDGCSLLGARLPDSIDVVISGFKTFRLEKSLQRLSSRSFTSREIRLQGQICGIKVSGRALRLFARARHLESRTSFGEHPIFFDATQLDEIAAAVASRAKDVELLVVEESFDEGRSKPRVKRTLRSIALSQMAQSSM